MSNQQINGKQILVGTPTDRSYGVTPSNTNVPGITSIDNLPDALDKIVSILDKLAPGKSPNLSTKFLSLIGTFYSARHVSSTIATASNVIWVSTATQSAATASNYSYIFIGTNPVVRVSDSSVVNSSLATFSDGQTGILQADIDYTFSAYRQLDSTYYTTASASSSPDVGTWDIDGTQSSSGCLTISFDGDPYNVAPNTGFWTSLKATMSGTQSFATSSIYNGYEHIYTISHSTTGTTPVFRFICDNGDGVAPGTLSNGPLFTVITQSSIKYISGIPSLSIGDMVSASYSYSNVISGGKYPLISRFYNSTRISRFTMVASASVNVNDLDGNGLPVIGGTTSVPYAYQGTWSVPGLTAAVISNMYSTNTLFNFTSYNVIGTNNNTTSNYGFSANGGAFTMSKIYIDTVSDETARIRSGDGLYPIFGSGVTAFGELYSPTYSLLNLQGGTGSTVSGEMMLQNGSYKYPTGDYSYNHPTAGKNYNELLSSPFNYLTYRWVTFNVGTITSSTSFVLTIAGSGITGLPTSNFRMYVTVMSAGTPVVGWLDVNAPFVSGSTPASNGDACYDSSSSTATSRKVLFGTTSRTGTVYVRIGIPLGSLITIQSVIKT
jgi:hypothetical protein